MRRFTLEDGSSAKFWEVSQSSTSVTVRFGRIGTDGQTKTTDLSDEDAAQGHCSKLVEQKLKKGYVEQPATGEASSLVQPSPRPAQPVQTAPAAGAEPDAEPDAAPEVEPDAVPDELAWRVPAAWRRDVLPIRGTDPVTAPALDVEAARAVLGDRRERARALVEDPSTPDDLRAAGVLALGQDKRLLRRSVTPTPTPLGEAAVAAAVLTGTDWGDTERVALAVLTLWWTEHPVELTVLATTELAGLHHSPSTSVRGLQRAAHHHYGSGALPGMLMRLRRLLAAADEPTYERALTALGAPGVDPVLAAILAPTRQDWLASALAQLSTSASGEQLRPLLLASCRSVADATTVLQSVTVWALSRHTAVAVSLAVHVGPPLAPLLLQLLDDVDAEMGRRLTGLLAAFPDDQAFAGLLERLDRRGVSEAVLKAKEVQPYRATRLLSEHAAGRGASARTSAAILRAHLAAHPQTRAVAPRLSRAGRAALEASEPAQDAGPVAAAGTLPPLLAEAPWERRRQAARPVVVTGLAPSLPTTVAWAPGERDSWRMQPRPWMTRGKTWEQALSARTWGMVSTLAAAPPEIGRRYLSAVDAAGSYCDVDEVKGLLAAHDLEAVPLALALARARPACAAALLPVRSAEVAAAMADWLVRAKSVRPTAQEWLARHPDAAATSLLPAALGKPGKERRAAERALRLVAMKDQGALEAAAAAYGDEAVAGTAALLAIDPVELLPAKVPAPPAWLDLHTLPPVLLADRGGRLPFDAVRRLLTCLALCQPGETYAGLDAVLPALDRTSVAELAWGVVEAWRLAGEPAKDGWVLTALGLVGDDETARRLSPLVTAWPKANGTAKAAAGLEALAGIGTDVALMHLHRISQRAPSKPLRERAARLMESVAQELGLTPEQLADRLVPDMGLDADGRKVLDYGPRQFVVGFDEALKPYVEEGGARRPALPKPGARDDAELAPAAYASFSALKKDVRTVAADQLRRFEQAMAMQRRWTAGEQRQHFVEHPLLWHLSRRLVWACFGADGSVRASFRVAEDRTLADQDDSGLTLPDDATVGIAHPLHLDGDLGTWTELFADYEILQPFPQLGREVLHLTDDERSSTVLKRFAGVPVETKRLFGLAHRGWERSSPEDAGIQGTLEKVLPDERMAVVVLDPGIVVGLPDEYPEQRLTGVHVVAAHRDHWDEGALLPLSCLDDVTASEVLRDLTRVAGS